MEDGPDRFPARRDKQRLRAEDPPRAGFQHSGVGQVGHNSRDRF